MLLSLPFRDTDKGTNSQTWADYVHVAQSIRRFARESHVLLIGSTDNNNIIYSSEIAKWAVCLVHSLALPVVIW